MTITYDNYTINLFVFPFELLLYQIPRQNKFQIAGKFEDINFVLNLYQMLTVTAADQNDDVVI